MSYNVLRWGGLRKERVMVGSLAGGVLLRKALSRRKFSRRESIREIEDDNAVNWHDGRTQPKVVAGLAEMFAR
jgi:hypothetical protein